MSELTVYNLRKEKYANALIAPGIPNRWNKEKEYVIYTGSSRALSVLELVVHRASISLESSYKLLAIKIDVSENDIETVKLLPENWHSLDYYTTLQNIGSEWYQSRQKLLLKVPSAIINKEYNYLINTSHPDFMTKVQIQEKEDFSWDKRLL
jgi:RES domain-containing protein